MAYFCTVTIKPIYTMKKEQIILDFLSFLEFHDFLASFFKLAKATGNYTSVIALLYSMPAESFIDGAFVWPDKQFDSWHFLSELWKFRLKSKHGF